MFGQYDMNGSRAPTSSTQCNATKAATLDTVNYFYDFHLIKRQQEWRQCECPVIGDDSQTRNWQWRANIASWMEVMMLKRANHFDAPVLSTRCLSPFSPFSMWQTCPSSNKQIASHVPKRHRTGSIHLFSVCHRFNSKLKSDPNANCIQLTLISNDRRIVGGISSRQQWQCLQKYKCTQRALEYKTNSKTWQTTSAIGTIVEL